MAVSTTQQFLQVEEIREGMLILKDNAVRGILMVSSQNFALKSEEEQQAIIFQFQNFLNSLDFPIQISIQSRRLNITGYIDNLKKLGEAQENPLLKKQTNDYRQFIEKLIGGGSIMSKTFFVTVPFSLIESLPAGGKSKFSNVKVKGGKFSEEEFQRMRNQLWQRMEFVALGLRRAGLQTIPLNTEELIELFWSWHHPKEAEVGYYPEIPPEMLK
ncbi:MAG TPA: hypothetical protein ENI13_00365 [candidate division CPR3 bacterium]|uniref:TraC-like domain-containing protein n=1 Tax=candidate division CPR3 bacterium TaxID=2268181 RepID=A0A7C1SUI5_UNCC3|nr:hypothetical protein [Patescibacteria group bacterium]HEB13416.1 hypothetical protein [candidate division CPR3 bacterium]